MTEDLHIPATAVPLVENPTLDQPIPTATPSSEEQGTSFRSILPDFRAQDQIANKQMTRQQEKILVKDQEVVRTSNNKFVAEQTVRRITNVLFSFILKQLLPLLLFLFLTAIGIGYILSPTDIPNPVAVIVVVNTEDREILDSAIALQKENYAPYILILGERRAKDAQSFSSIAQANGIPITKLIAEQAGVTRYEQALATEKILDERGFSSMILVAPPYEQRKIAMTFRGAFRVLSSETTIVNAPASVPYWDRIWWWTNETGREKTFNELAEIIDYWQSGYF